MATTPEHANAEIEAAWDGPLFERFVQYRDTVVVGLKNHGDAAMSLFPPADGDRVLDIGCGFGDTTQQLAELAGPTGSAHGVDISERFIEAATAEAREAGATNVTFQVADVQETTFDGPF